MIVYFFLLIYFDVYKSHNSLLLKYIFPLTGLLSSLGFITIDKTNHLPVTIAGVFALISGLINAHFASPTVKNMGSDAVWWRIGIYGIKIPCFLALTPALNKLVSDSETQNMIKFGAIMTLFLVSSAAKFFRESFNPTMPKKID